MYRLGLGSAKQGQDSRRQPGNSPQGDFSHIACERDGGTRLASAPKTQEHLIATPCLATATQRGGRRHGVIREVNDRD